MSAPHHCIVQPIVKIMICFDKRNAIIIKLHYLRVACFVNGNGILFLMKEKDWFEMPYIFLFSFKVWHSSISNLSMNRLEWNELCLVQYILLSRKGVHVKRSDVNAANIVARCATKRDERVDISKRRPGMSIHR